ncbi:hypothetical protein BV22DRAFT_590646 [Leucogyrophana mollusca]|uniref:Uncharacterized protein n=1 Tax=Leucogyrophana mollusca TaxID=85980 RepID=A0ACB8BDL3_9AGAM|nr:hypothetical protein BV22DRAFT_590646 [Leucogyrophana mollusca]
MPDLATTQCTSDTALQKRWSLQPTPPTQIRRRGKRLQDGSGSHKVPALAMSGSKATAPPGWSRISHPEGGYYFCDERKNICTMVNLLDTTMQSAISSFADQLRDDPRLQSCLEVDPDVVLVLHYSYEATTEDTPRCGYYLVSSIGRRVFWLEDFDLPCDIKGCDDSTCLEVQYWRHWQLFPSTCKLTEDIVDTLKSVLLHTCGDHLTAKFSTSQYNRDDLKYMIDLVNEIKLDNNNTHDSSAWLIGKLMTLCKLDELRSSYGQKGEHTAFGRLGPGSRAYERSLPMWLLSPFLLRSPEIYATELHSFRDNFTLLRWRKFVDKVDISIRDSNLLATVLLGTNIGFLSIQSVDDGTVPGSRSPVQIIIYCSTIGSLGSIIVGLVIFKQYRAQGADSLLTAVSDCFPCSRSFFFEDLARFQRSRFWNASFAGLIPWRH